MIVERSTNAVWFIRTNFLRLLAVVAITAAAEVANNHFELDRPAFSIAAVSLLVTALSIFLVFRVNEAYQRWWEARTLWGAIVNDSRSFARQVCTLIVPASDDAAERSAVTALRRELVLRQVAWVNALRLALRREQDVSELAGWLPAGELETITDRTDKPSSLLVIQAGRLAEARAAGRLGDIEQHRIESTLTSLQDSQGGCERIKNTPFPDRVVYFTRACAWGLALFIPVALMTKSDGFDLIDYAVVPFMMMAFLVTERLGAELKNPCESQPNDTPMSSLCRTIEIGLREQIGDDEVPAPLEPEKGVLM